ncbi:T9SS type A sorting domain-containing protein [Aquimarina sp. U1-2]|uniref:T9SS type A sorting domain-containing protein n=1 Tax=Aquimarina sp. U1-2 TaxID=2823141 RepID=UPI001AED0410|nr:T9SS type A sorting domain-containing protein [Aquimarina sp. U1-2]MBP2833597.1 T9SS type A sorting domain-containing protein [Aquimarina sp. U1-2]
MNYIKKTIPLLTLILFNYSYSQFNETPVFDPSVTPVFYPDMVTAFDLDGDNDTDIIFESGDKLRWFENDKGDFESPKILIENIRDIKTIEAKDLDNDNDLDLIIFIPSRRNNTIRVYENLGDGILGDEKTINIGYPFAGGSLKNLIATDIDGDNDNDIILVLHSGIFWIENIDGNGNFDISNMSYISVKTPEYMIAKDVDFDNDIDIVAHSNEEVFWIENKGNATSFVDQNISTYRNEVRAITVLDIDNDDDIDVVTAIKVGRNDEKIVLSRNQKDNGGNFTNQEILSSTNGEDVPRQIFSSDIDNDGDLDILYKSFERTMWIENVDGQNFDKNHLISKGFRGVNLIPAHLDGDGYKDIISFNTVRYYTIAWQKNLGNGIFSNYNVLNIVPFEAYQVLGADFDNDGDQDLVSISENPIFSNEYGNLSWYENRDGNGNYSSQKLISSDLGIIDAFGTTAVVVVTGDIDSDGDIDIAATYGKTIVWYENIDGNGNFIDHRRLVANEQVKAIQIADIDGDNDNDFIITPSDFGENKVSWYENIDGNGKFAEFPNEISISLDLHETDQVIASDIDGDNDLDVIFDTDSRLYWYENTDGKGNFTLNNDTSLILVLNSIESFAVEDIDGDNDLDILSVSSKEDKIYWSENLDGNGKFGTANVISSDLIGGNFVVAGDIDNDGDKDIIAAASLYNKSSWPVGTTDFLNKIVWYENIDGNGSFGNSQIITENIDKVEHLYLSYINKDKKIDIASASSKDKKIAWFENRIINELDLDDDGVDNDIDLCPNTSIGETVNPNGCSQSQIDDDNDGVTNDIDLCPNTPIGETVNSNGCSQSQLDDDNDGVTNDKDLCPNTSIGATVNSNGCSQSQLDDDNDGVTNDIDLCPNTPIGETVNSNGCSQSQLDDDNDGVTNDKDSCPTTPLNTEVDNFGCPIAFQLPPDNFKIRSIGETCIGKGNGQIHINTTEVYDYAVTVGGKEYTFDSDLLIENLKPAQYEICITIPKYPEYEQCFNSIVAAATPIDGKSTTLQNSTDPVEMVKITSGTPPYAIFINNKEVFSTDVSVFSVKVAHGDRLKVATKIACEGVYEKQVILDNHKTLVYPNPTKEKLSVFIPNNSKSHTDIAIYDTKGQLILSGLYEIKNNKIEISLLELSKGIYFMKIKANEPKFIKIIKQ